MDYIYKNASNSYTVRFSNNAADNYFVIMEYQGKTLAFGLKDSNATNAVKLEKIDSVDSKILSNTVDAQSCIAYKDVYQDIDLIYESKTYGLKEYIVLKRPTGKNEFYFNIKMDGLKVKEENGSIVFVDKDDNAIFYIEQPFAIDNNEVITEDVKYTIVESNGAYQIKSTIDKAYLTDASRAYPIVIDPSVMITGALTTYDSYVSSKYPDTNYYLNYYLRTGRDSDYYIRRTYIKFDLPTNIPAEYVTSAYLRMEKYSGATPSIKAYRVTGYWESSTITWNNQPSYTTTYASPTAYNDSGNWWRMTVTDIVKRWFNGTYSKYGFMVRDDTESGTTQWTTFYSSDASSPHKPELHINFTGYGSRPYEYETFPYFNCANYALDYYDEWGLSFGITLEGLNSCSNEADLWTYTKNCVSSWLQNHMSGKYNSLSSYQSYISGGKWRVVLRMGYEDRNGNGIVDIDNRDPSKDCYDFHWWYQTDTGQWAEKMGASPSNLVSGTNANTNPYNVNWPNSYFGFAHFYDSSCVYYAIWE